MPKISRAICRSELPVACLQAKAGITEDIIEVLTNTSAELSKGRRKRPMPAGLASPASIEQYGLLSSHPLHKTSEVSSPETPTYSHTRHKPCI